MNKLRATFRLSSEDEDDLGQKQQLFSISQAQQHYNQFIVRIHSTIGPPSEYSALLQLLDSVNEGDEVLLDLNSRGGVLDTAILISRAIRGCNGLVKARIGPTCASATTVIALACEGFETDSDSEMHIHTASFDLGYGKTPDIVAAAVHNDRKIEKFIRKTYKNLLTEEEIEQVLSGREFYLDSEELTERLERYVEERDKELFALLEELEPGSEIILDTEERQDVVSTPDKPKRRSKRNTQSE